MPLKSASKLVCKQHEFKGYKCLPSNGHYFSTAYPFAEIFDLLDSQQSKEKKYGLRLWYPIIAWIKHNLQKFKNFT